MSQVCYLSLGIPSGSCQDVASSLDDRVPAVAVVPYEHPGRAYQESRGGARTPRARCQAERPEALGEIGQQCAGAGIVATPYPPHQRQARANRQGKPALAATALLATMVAPSRR